MATELFEIKGSGVLFYESAVKGVQKSRCSDGLVRVSLAMSGGVFIHFTTNENEHEFSQFMERFQQRPGEQ